MNRNSFHYVKIIQNNIRSLAHLYVYIYISHFNLTHTTISDFLVIKRFCEDILRIIHQLGVGECSLKGFLAHKLYEARKQLRQMQMQQRLSEYESEANVSV